jgi:hypothetical protein
MEKMERLTRALVAVPKDEVEKKARAYERRKKKRKTRRPKS